MSYTQTAGNYCQLAEVRNDSGQHPKHPSTVEREVFRLGIGLESQVLEAPARWLSSKLEGLALFSAPMLLEPQSARNATGPSPLDAKHQIGVRAGRVGHYAWAFPTTP